MKFRTSENRLYLCFCLSALGLAQDVASFEKRMTVKKLPNGLTLVICERPEAPVFSFFTLVDAGSAQDPMMADRTGAHVRAHGIQRHRQDRHDRLCRRKAGAGKSRESPTPPTSPSATRLWDATKQKLKQLEKSWKDAIAEADKFVVSPTSSARSSNKTAEKT